jgi:hypothetical protein
MFDTSLDRLTGAQLAARIAANHAQLLDSETQVLVLACAWADLHYADPDQPYSPLVERACAWGGEGTPEVSEFCAAEFGTLQGVGIMSGRAMIADALDLRHRLPRLWTGVQAGAVRAWQARKIAQATRSLSWPACGDVDLAISGYVGMLAWSRFQKILTAAIIDADPEAAAARAERARTERGVWVTESDDGLKTVIGRATSGDVTWFMAAVNRIADILAVEGDSDPVGARRSKAIGILAQPGRALDLLVDHQHDPDDPAQGTEPDRSEDQDVASHLEHDSEEAHDPDQGPTADDGRAGDATVDESRAAPSASSNRERTSLDLTRRSTGGKASRPRVTLVFHLSDAAVRDGHGTVRPEHGDPQTLAQLHGFLADTGCQVTVRPVIDPAEAAPIDGYEIPHRIRAAVRLRHPGETFPYGSGTGASLDLDHTIPYRPMIRGGPSGQTGVDTLGPLSRPVHRATTLGRWQRRQPDPGSFVWRSPNGWVHLLTNHGNLRLGNSSFAQAIWRAAVTASEQPLAVPGPLGPAGGSS